LSLASTIEWQIATVRSIHVESPRVKLFTLELPAETPFRAGQHFDVRLTASDGYQAQRSYSVSSSPEPAPNPTSIEFAVELIADGEVSSYFHEAVEVGDQIEIRGPIGGHFTWSPIAAKPVMMIAGGSGIAPIMSMIRHRSNADVIKKTPMLLMFSARTEADMLFAAELESIAVNDPDFHLIVALTRSEEVASGNRPFRHLRRIDGPMIESALSNLATHPSRSYICGGSSFVEAMANHLLDLGIPNNSIRTERFGP
jgi:ferredoxin-NADP reductase